MCQRQHLWLVCREVCCYNKMYLKFIVMQRIVMVSSCITRYNSNYYSGYHLYSVLEIQLKFVNDINKLE